MGTILYVQFDCKDWFKAEVLKSTPGKANIRYLADNTKETITFPDPEIMLESDYLTVYGDDMKEPIEEKKTETKKPFSLPPFKPSAAPMFKWAERNGTDFKKDIDEAYEVTTTWRKNVFDLPSGNSGKKFVQQLVMLNDAYATASPLECVSQKAEMVITPLLLQRPHSKSTPKENNECLKRRHDLWIKGDIKALLKEGTAIQSRLESSGSRPDDATIAKRFAEMMFNGNGKGAMRYVVDQAKGGVLPLNDETKAILKKLHPDPEKAIPETLITGDIPEDVDQVVFTALDGSLIKKCALRTEGAAGISQADDRLWHKMVTSYKETSSELCRAVAAATRRFATEFVDPESLEALLANRGIPLDKCPGLRPVGIGEVKRRVMGKAIMEIVGKDVQKAAGSMQLCAGQSAGVEAAIHAMRNIFAADETDGVLLVDADNAFNRANREAALWNIQYVCPILKFTLINTYRVPSRIFVLGGFEISSQEGTTQGCPLAMAMYALAIVPLVNHLHGKCNQVWFADDGTGADKLSKLRKWWDALVEKGPGYGYFPKPSKSWLIVKGDLLDEAKKIFDGTGVQITTEGMRHLGAAIGNENFKDTYVQKKIVKWIDSIEKLSKIALTQPHAAFSAFIQRIQSRWIFLLRTVPSLAEALQPLEDAIRQKFIPSLLGREVNDLERELFSMPARYAGLSICNPTKQCDRQFANSEELTAPLLALLVIQERNLDPTALGKTQDAIRQAQKFKREDELKKQLEDIRSKVSPSLQLAIKLATEKGASSWVTARPMHDHSTVLHKGEFRDAVYLRYGWEPLNLPETCGCGKPFNAVHAMECMVGGFRGVMHNEVNYVFFSSCREAGFKDVTMEPELQPLNGETFKYKSANVDEEARSDLRVCGFWTRLRRAFFDVTAFSPFARSNQTKTNNLAQLFKREEGRKSREYRERIRNVEHADFNPLVFSTSGGMGYQASVVVKRIALALAEKKNQTYSVVVGWLRCRLSFALLRTTLLCLRGSRPHRPKKIEDIAIDLAVGEAHMGKEDRMD